MPDQPDTSSPPPPPPPRPGPALEGVVPRQALCAKCGYLFGGIPIRAGVIVCPECSHAQEFTLAPRHSPALRRMVAAARVFRWVVIGIVAALVLYSVAARVLR